MEKLNKSAGQSMDIVADNITKLKELFPEILAENKIDFKALQALLGEEIEVEDERYSFNWHGKTQARKLAQTPSTGTLRPCQEESVDWDDTKNLFIEGDNLEVLKLLQKSYHKLVKMIYIDPPYNTGSDFVYPDNFKDNIQNYLELTGQVKSGRKLGTNTEASGRFHTDWLNMIYPRLKLARNLLKDDGIIFISINDREVDNLHKVCSEIFGEENFISKLIWRNGRTAAAHFTNEHEYIVCFAKNKATLPFFIFSGDANISDRAIKKPSEKNPVSTIRFPAGLDFESEDKRFPNLFGEGEPVKVVEGIFEAKDGKLLNEVVLEAAWTMKDMIEQWIDGQDVIDQKGQKVVRFFFKSNGVLQYEKEKGTIHPKSIIEGISTKGGSSEIKALLAENIFDFPKPTDLIKLLIETVVNSDDIVMDFFAGSGTTAHATMLQNVDGVKRKFILVQLPEALDPAKKEQKVASEFCDLLGKPRNIAELTKERLRRASIKVKKDNPETQGDLGFKVFKLSSSNLKTWDANFDSLAHDLAEATQVVKADRNADDVLFEILLKYGLDLTLPIDTRSIAGKTVYEVGAGALIVCLDDGVTEAVAEGIGKLKEELEPEVMRVVFKDSSFASDAAKVNAVQVLKQYGIDDVKSI
jgi:adenine-specific DNA-methyltransferase